MFMDFEVSRSCGLKANQNHHPSTTMTNGWFEMFVLMCCVGTWSVISPLVSSVQQPLFQKSWPYNTLMSFILGIELTHI